MTMPEKTAQRDFEHPFHVSVTLVAALCIAVTLSVALLFVTACKCYRKRSRSSFLVSRRGIKTFYTRPSGSAHSSSDLSSPDLPPSRTPSPLLTPIEGTAKSPGKIYAGTTGGVKLDPATLSKECYTEESETKDEGPAEKVEEATEDLGEERQNMGILNLSIEYNNEKNVFIVTIHRASYLPAKDPQSGTSDPYIKLCLLPEKKHKVKTRVLRKTLNPVYEETFTFYGLAYNQLQGITLHFIVMSFDRFSRDDVIGEVVVPLANVDLSGPEVNMTREIKQRVPRLSKSQGRGEILVSLCHQPAANRLTVVVLKAKNLPKMDVTGLADPYVKINMLYGNQRMAKKKTRLKKRTLNPVFNESFLFDIPQEGLEDISLEFQVLDHDRVTKNEVIGRLEIGPSCEAETSQSLHWQEVLQNPRKQIAEWHKLTE
ncbi:Synaptotagmin-4 [Holothuria leucospilota]|uniref:Synaptotagmin-4 n=1 Tax=Holothuria leucospilota TaxID=206669 RepID=A0A9Q1BNB7_HOLLE|nr:Synaptotagmin-4 [Holothuria leucospilota]